MLNATQTKACFALAIYVEIATVGWMNSASSPNFASTLIQSRPISERPKTAKERREHSLAAFLYKHIGLNCEFDNADTDEMIRDLNKMELLGRTQRWLSAINTLKAAARNDKVMIHQFITYANYAA